MTTSDDLTPRDPAPAPPANKPPAKKPTTKKPAPKKVAPRATTDEAPAGIAPAEKRPDEVSAAKPKKAVAATKPPTKKIAPTPQAAAAGDVSPSALEKEGTPKPAGRKRKVTEPATSDAPPVEATSGPSDTPAPFTAPEAPPLPASIANSKPASVTTPVAEHIEPTASPIPSSKKHPHRNAAKILNRAAKSRKDVGFSIMSAATFSAYWRLMRMDRPIGTLLLLWPTLWSLWIAAKGMPSVKNLVIFVLGVVVMRAAGCVINDFADRKIDGRVERTKGRPLATGAISSRAAIGLFIVLCLIAFTLVLFTDPLTIKLSAGGLLLAFCYPFMKRHTHLPQVVLGAAFAWGIPMAYSAEAGELHQGMWLIYLAVVLWTVAYDTFYAMVDREDDLKIGVKSTAILFGEHDRLMTGILQAMCLYALLLVGNRFELGTFYYLSLVVAAALFAYQQWLIRYRARAACFSAFLNNNWVGMAIFAGIVMDYSLR
jgi:4-hydroxybenzoate polyprenyltransferase